MIEQLLNLYDRLNVERRRQGLFVGDNEIYVHPVVYYKLYRHIIGLRESAFRLMTLDEINRVMDSNQIEWYTSSGRIVFKKQNATTTVSRIEEADTLMRMGLIGNAVDYMQDINQGTAPAPSNWSHVDINDWHGLSGNDPAVDHDIANTRFSDFGDY